MAFRAAASRSFREKNDATKRKNRNCFVTLHFGVISLVHAKRQGSLFPAAAIGARVMPRENRGRLSRLGTGRLAPPAERRLGESRRARKAMVRIHQGYGRHADRRSDLRPAPPRARKGGRYMGRLPLFRAPHAGPRAGPQLHPHGPPRKRQPAPGARYRAAPLHDRPETLRTRGEGVLRRNPHGTTAPTRSSTARPTSTRLI